MNDTPADRGAWVELVCAVQRFAQEMFGEKAVAITIHIDTCAYGECRLPLRTALADRVLRNAKDRAAAEPTPLSLKKTAS